MLSVRTLLRHNGIEVADVACRHGCGHGAEEEPAGCFAVVFVRRGCFVRRSSGDGGVAPLLDPTLAYCMNSGEDQRFDHPNGHGDDCTTVALSPQLVATLSGGSMSLPHGPLRVSPALDLSHRMLLSDSRAGLDPELLAERSLVLIASTLEASDERPVNAGRPATQAARKALADGVRELLATDRNHSLLDLSRELATSPHHLSRSFKSMTGSTIARHRLRLRARDALERLAQGERDLARLAADVGLADQSHLCRVIAAETGRTPAALGSALAPGPQSDSNGNPRRRSAASRAVSL